MKKLTNAVLIVVLTSSFSLVKAQEGKKDSLKTKEIQGVVVTALGIKKEKRALTYSAQEIGGEDLVKVKDANPINNLSGRVAGVTIGRSSSGIGGSVKVTLRGVSSSRENQPLYVIDGLPINNSTPVQPASIWGDTGGSRDGGDALSLINPDDIENITVLRGASSAALYGSQGANGVILITTKKGKTGKISLNFNSNITAETAAYYPKLQYEYLAKIPGEGGSSWGAKGNSQNYANKFLKTGLTAINSISLSASNNMFSSYLSYANTSSNGIIPTSGMKQNNFTFRESVNLFGDKLKVDATVNVSEQRYHNRPTNGLYFNPLTGIYGFPRGEDYNDYTTNYETAPDTTTYIKGQHVFKNPVFAKEIDQNPYWILNRTATDENNKRAYLKGSVSYVATDWLTIQARASYDYTNRKYQRKMYAGTSDVLSKPNGRYIEENIVDVQWYTDLIATANKSFGDFDVSGVLGSSKSDYKIGQINYADSGFAGNFGLRIPNYFVFGNFINTGSFGQDISTDKETKSIFASAQVGYNKAVYLDLTARKDWSSALKNPYFYPSVGLSTILNKYLDFGDKVKFLKVRGSYAQVGNDIPSFVQDNKSSKFGRLNGGALSEPSISSFPGLDLKPELKKSWELGLEGKFFNNRLGIDFTYYHTNTINQYFEINAPANALGVTKYAINGGDIETKGIEASINFIPVKNEDFEWNSTLNFGTNKSYVKALSDLLKKSDGTVAADLTGLDNSFRYRLVEGQRFGTIMVNQLAKDSNGLAIFDKASGTAKGNGMVAAGTPFPDWNAGWVNTLNYKNFTLNLVIDGKMGGKAVSTTQAMLDQAGVSKASADARNTNGGLIKVSDGVGGTFDISAEKYYNSIGGRSGYTSEYLYDLSNFRLAEFSLGYNFMPKNSFINKANISIVGRNLFFIYKKSKNIPFDPNVVSSTGESFQGIEVFSQPSTRSIGVNLSVNF